MFRILSRRVRVYRKREHLLFRLKVSAAWVNSSTIDLLLSPLPAVFLGDATSCFRLRDIPQRAAKDTKSNTSVNWPPLRGKLGPIINRKTVEKIILNRKTEKNAIKTENPMQNYQNRYIFTSQLLKSWSIWYGGDKCSIQNKLHLFHYRIYECYGLGIRIF